jgi:hypothetical protein
MSRRHEALGGVAILAAAAIVGLTLSHLPSTTHPAAPHTSSGVPAATPTTTTTGGSLSAALTGVAELPVSDSYVSGYQRSAFGQAWADTNRNGCDTRNDVLRADLTTTTIKAGTNGCVVLSGVLADPYTGTTIHFTRGYSTSEAVPIDHIVPLGWAWQHGAATWTATKREDFANDLDELQAVDEASNTAKSDSGPATWMPPANAYSCTYDTRWVSILTRYRLSIDTADKTALTRTLTACAH